MKLVAMLHLVFCVAEIEYVQIQVIYRICPIRRCHFPPHIDKILSFRPFKLHMLLIVTELSNCHDEERSILRGFASGSSDFFLINRSTANMVNNNGL